MAINLNAAKARELTDKVLSKERQLYEPLAEQYITDYIEREIRKACERGHKSCEITMPGDKILRKYVRKCLEENGFLLVLILSGLLRGMIRKRNTSFYY